MSGGREALDGPGLLAALSEAGLDYIIIGGLAVIAHGYQRATKDIDIVPNPTRSNLTLLTDVLSDLDYEIPGMEEFRQDEIVHPTLEALEAGGNWVLSTRLGRLDILQRIEPEMDYERLSADSVEDEVFGQTVRFCSYEDLLKMKEAAGRPQDLADIGQLRAVRGE